MAKVEDLATRNEELSADRDKWEEEAEALRKLNKEIKEKLHAQEMTLAQKDEEIQNLRGKLPSSHENTNREFVVKFLSHVYL